VRRRSNADRLPERFDEGLAAGMEFADPILSGTSDATVWVPGYPQKLLTETGAQCPESAHDPSCHDLEGRDTCP
jgi:hypothetical protein